jgi:zinc D-Ala-D-Ala carboxypeptidase
MNRMRISEHISFEEGVLSPTAIRNGIDNMPNDAQLHNMKMVAENVFEPLRKMYGKPIKINSFFRSEKLNQLVKGQKGSQHTKGQAIDITTGTKAENKKLFELAKTLEFDQLINEYDFSWIHISFANYNRKQILIIK